MSDCPTAVMQWSQLSSDNLWYRFVRYDIKFIPLRWSSGHGVRWYLSDALIGEGE